jgi:hypothetical protein
MKWFLFKKSKMKTFKILILIVSLAGWFSCNKNETENIKNVDVEKYIELLKSNQYDFPELPPFSYQDIPALSIYRNETQLITNFPHNMISSLGKPECSLGMYVLWTIESIRAVAIKSEYLIGRFPSQNPVLALRDAEELKLVFTEESQVVAAKAYFDWWKENENKEFDEFKNIDPLLKTKYRWH